jgi:beta-phosphoglucomutase family hydrolase
MTIRRGVLWDMDGVLVDTGEAHYQSWADVLADYGVSFSRDFFRETFGMNNVGILTLLFGDRLTPDLLEEIAGRKEEAFRDQVRGHVQPLPGVLDWLPRLEAQGFQMGIASSAPSANIDALIDELRLRSYFDTLVSGVDMLGKPDPALFLEVARRLDLPPERCIVVEDAKAGVEAAKRANMKCIAVTTTNPADALAAADIIVDRLDALPEDAFECLLA